MLSDFIIADRGRSVMHGLSGGSSSISLMEIFLSGHVSYANSIGRRIMMIRFLLYLNVIPGALDGNGMTISMPSVLRSGLDQEIFTDLIFSFTMLPRTTKMPL